MTGDVRSKLLPRNVAALRRFQDPAAAPREVTGNPVMTRLAACRTWVRFTRVRSILPHI